MLRNILLCTLFFYNTLHASNLCQDHSCLAIVDAGSTGSRLHVYSYDKDSTGTAIQIKEAWVKKISPGLASIEPSPEKIHAYLSLLFSSALKEDIPVYFYATAGMRLLPKARQNAFYQQVQAWFGSQEYWKLRAAKTISGKDEGIFAWLAMNYQSGHLQDPKSELAGIMDIGGGSVQISFPQSDTSASFETDSSEISIYGRKILLYSHSFLGLGQTEVSHQFLDFPACFANNYPLPDSSKGQGDAKTCSAEIAKLLNHVHGVHRLIAPVLTLNPIKSWYVLGGVTYLAEDTLFQFPKNEFTNEELLQQADNTICHQQWEILSAANPTNGYLYGYCLLPAYYYALMTKGYGLTQDQTIKYLPTKQAGDWTLGVVLNPGL